MKCHRRTAVLAFAVLLGPWSVQAQPAAAETIGNGFASLKDGQTVLFRHAEAPGTGDPAGFKLGDCSTQRNLSETGRDQARRIGERFRQAQVKVGAVRTSQWCRTRDTAELAFPGQARDDPDFNSFFGENRTQEAAQTEAARRTLAAWRGPGVQAVVTHQVNITALTGIVPASGEAVVVQWQDGALRVVGRVRP